MKRKLRFTAQLLLVVLVVIFLAYWLNGNSPFDNKKPTTDTVEKVEVVSKENEKEPIIQDDKGLSRDNQENVANNDSEVVDQTEEKEPQEPAVIEEAVSESISELTIVQIDTGQSDAMIAKYQDFTMLIDAGDNGSFHAIKNALDNLNVSNIDILVATHTHADHIGSMDSIIPNYTTPNATKLLMHQYPSSTVSTSKTYERLLTAAIERQLLPMASSQGQIVYQDDQFSIQELTLTGVESIDQNNSSIILKITLGDFSLLTTGDVEDRVEDRLYTAYGSQLSSIFLKSPHHGSNTSSSSNFLNAVNPQVILIPVGQNNKYGHPHTEVIERYQQLGATVLQTKDSGTITVIGYSDGSYDIQSER